MSGRLMVCCLVLSSLLCGYAQAGDIDETALREYVAQKRPERVAAETRRLRKLYPGWTVPTDLWTARPSGLDEAPLWELYEAGSLAQLHKEMDERQAREPNWRPSDDLTRKIAAREFRGLIMDKVANGQWTEVAQSLRDKNLAGMSDDVELMWFAAEAYARTERIADAAATYRLVLDRSSDARQRIATLQKALVTLPMAEVDKLIAAQKSESRKADSFGEFDAIGVDITRARLASFLRGEPSTAIDPVQLAALDDVVRQSSDSRQGGLLAWYAFRRGNFDKALEWFKWSIVRGGDATIAHGLALTLNKLGFRREAEDVAYAWREQAANNAILFIDTLETDLTRETPPKIEPARLTRYAEVTLKLQSGEGAQGLAWYAYNSCQFETALEWFQHAAAWFPKEATIYGYAMTLQRLKRQREFLDVVNRYDGAFPSVVGLIFKDEFARPPGPCDRVVGARIAGGVDQNIDDRRISVVSDRNPTPDSIAMRQATRAEFPLMVSPENPLRFAPQDLVLSAANVIPFVRKEPRFERPQIARRVPGASPMPYERLNIALLPAWNGAVAASFPPALSRAPATGTIWSQEAAALERDPSNKAPADRATFVTNRFHP